MWENFISICDGQKDALWKELGLNKIKSLILNTRTRSPPPPPHTTTTNKVCVVCTPENDPKEELIRLQLKEHHLL